MSEAVKVRRALPVFGAELNRRSSHGLGAPLPSDKQHRPVYVVWELTQACDHACGHCGSRSGRALPDELSTDEALGLVAQMAALGVREVTLIGGEAYLHPGFLEVARAIVNHGMHCSVTSGGRAIDDARAHWTGERFILLVVCLQSFDMFAWAML